MFRYTFAFITLLGLCAVSIVEAQYGGGAPSMPGGGAAPKKAPTYQPPPPPPPLPTRKKPSAPQSYTPPPSPVYTPPSGQPPFGNLSENPAQIPHSDAQEILVLIEEQLAAIQAHDINRAYFLYTSDIFKQHTPFDEFQYFVENYSIFTHNKNALFGIPEFVRNGAVIKGTLTALDGKVYRAEYHFVKENNQWKIKGIKLFPAPSRADMPQAVPAGANYDFQSDIQR